MGTKKEGEMEWDGIGNSWVEYSEREQNGDERNDWNRIDVHRI
jgi:hypothetical protein